MFYGSYYLNVVFDFALIFFRLLLVLGELVKEKFNLLSQTFICI